MVLPEFPENYFNNLLLLIGVLILSAIGIIVLAVYLIGGIKALKILGISAVVVVALGLLGSLKPTDRLELSPSGRARRVHSRRGVSIRWRVHPCTLFHITRTHLLRALWRSLR